MGRFVTYVLVLAIVLPAVAAAHIGEPGGGAAPTTTPVPAPPAPAPPAPAPTGSTPALRALRLVPLTVQGLRFAARERVVLTLLGSDGVALKETTVAADAEGSFTTSFGYEQGSRCDTLVRAVGSSGNRALLKVLPGPACLPV